MAWDEALFSVAWDGARRLLVPRAPTERRVEVEPERARLEALARLLSGRALTVTLTDEPGGLRGEVLFLPRVFDFAPTSELNREALLARVALNLVAAPAYVSRGVAVLDAALAAPGRRAAAVAQFPSLATLLPRLERAALDRRAPIDVADARAAAIEATVRLALGAAPDGLQPEAA